MAYLSFRARTKYTAFAIIKSPAVRKTAGLVCALHIIVGILQVPIRTVGTATAYKAIRILETAIPICADFVIQKNILRNANNIPAPNNARPVQKHFIIFAPSSTWQTGAILVGKRASITPKRIKIPPKMYFFFIMFLQVVSHILV